MLRINRLSWWKDELPTKHEMQRGRDNLKKVGYKVGEPDKWQIWIGWRHATIFKDMYDAGIVYDKSDYQQGFITDEKPMHFATREEAFKIAYEAGQTKELKSTLFSEDLWQWRKCFS